MKRRNQSAPAAWAKKGGPHEDRREPETVDEHVESWMAEREAICVESRVIPERARLIAECEGEAIRARYEGRAPSCTCGAGHRWLGPLVWCEQPCAGCGMPQRCTADDDPANLWCAVCTAPVPS